MKKTQFNAVHRLTTRQTGIAAIELALLLPILIPFLTLGVFTISVFWHYTMAQKAAQDAARYLATVSPAEMMSPASANAAGALAQQIVRQEIAEILPTAEVPGIDTFCNDATCGLLAPGTLPTTVRVRFSMSLFDPSGRVDTGWYGLQITANYTMRYVGN